MSKKAPLFAGPGFQYAASTDVSMSKVKSLALCPPNRGGVTFRSYKGVKGPSNNTDKLISFFTQLTFLAVWKSLSTLSAPIARVLAFYLWAGRSILKLCSWSERVVLKLLGWLAAPAFPHSRWLRQWGRHYVPLDIRKWHVVVAVMVTASLVNSLVRKWQESFDERLRQLRYIQQRMKSASSYAEWREFAQQLDKMGHCRGGDNSGKIRENLYDRRLLQQKWQHLQSVREKGNVKEMMFALRTDLVRNIANIAKSQLHEHFYAVPAPIRDYIQEVKAQLAMLTDWPDGGVDIEEKLAFFRETRHTFGRTALLLSGGGGLGSFHLGVVKALFEHTMLPRVLAGSSVGSIVAGIISTRTDDEMREMFRKLDDLELTFFNNNRPVELVTSFLQKGALHDMSYLQRKLKQLIGNYTFLEAYERTGRILNVSVCPADTNEPARLLNYLTAPQALIWSAVAASSAFPGLFHPQDILARNAMGEEVRFSVPSAENVSRRWRDGSLELDLPTFLLSEMFNCNHFIVSQTNPHIAPLLNLKKSLSRRWANLLELELRHRCAQMQWMLPDWFPTKWLTLFTQPWEGDITLVLPSHMWKLGKTMINPTTAEILDATKQGELAIWEKLSAIETNCTIEATLDACLARLTNKARERPLCGLTTRIPSWLSMSAIGQQAVASWGNPLDAGNSPGGRLWGPRVSGSLNHLPSLLQGQALNPAAAAAAAAAVMSPSAAAAAKEGIAGSPAAGTAAGGVPATVGEAMAAMANGSALGGVHRGYSYTATPLHAAHLQQHGNPAQLAAMQQQHTAAGLMAAAAAAAGHLQVPPTVHENMPDDQPPRVTSWGSNDIADSVSDFPAGTTAGSSGGGSSRVCARGLDGTSAMTRLGSLNASTAAVSPAAAVGSPAAAASWGTRSRPGPRSGLLVGFDSKSCLVDDESQQFGSKPASSVSSSRSSKSSRSSRSRRSSRSSADSGSSSSSGRSQVPPEVLAEMDCCDSSAVTDIWSSLLPLATSSLALTAASEGLDFIAP